MHADTEPFDHLYHVPGEAPWTFQEPHPLLVALVAQHKIPLGRVLEVGCGEGYHAIYLASRGCTVTAIDCSSNAIQYAQEHSRDAKVRIEFLKMDYRDLSTWDRQFDFVFDWRFLHEITDEEARRVYVKNVARCLGKGGKYLSVAFSGSADYWGSGILRTAPNTHLVLYFAMWEDLQRLFSPYFTIVEKQTITAPHSLNQFPLFCISSC